MSPTIQSEQLGQGEQIGLIGLGLMGSAIASVLDGHGIRVLGWDLSPSAWRNAEGNNDVFEKCDRILLSLPNAKVVHQVLCGVSLRPGQTIIDTSTGAPAEVEEIAKHLADRGVHYLDATISGSSAQILDRTALAMVGGDKHDFARNRELLEVLCERAEHVGPCGYGSKMKIVTNVVLGLNRAALAEGLAFAASLGLELDRTLAIMRSSMAYSRIMDTKGEKMIHGDFTPQAKLAQHLKDVRIALAATPLKLPLTETHRMILEKSIELGYGELDNSAIIKTLEAPCR